MPRAFLGVGANLQPEENVTRALRLLAETTRLLQISTVYLTPPEGRPEQPPYYNCVVEIGTELTAAALKEEALRVIEEKLGRVRSEDKYAARPIDLDLIVYDGRLLDEEALRRPFIAIPLAELAPELNLPISATTPEGAMEPLAEYTEFLRREILHGP